MKALQPIGFYKSIPFASNLERCLLVDAEERWHYTWTTTTAPKRDCIKCKQSKVRYDFLLNATQYKEVLLLCKACVETELNTVKAKSLTKGQYISSRKDGPCMDCANHFPTFCMDLDHLPQYIKSFSLSTRKGKCWAEIINEVHKCESVCAVCHRLRTYDRQMVKRKNKNAIDKWLKEKVIPNL